MTEPTYGSQPAGDGESTPPPQPAYQSPQFPPTQPQPQAQAPLSPGDERNWAMGAHLSSFVAAWIALGVLGPLVVMLFVGQRSPFVRRHAVEALNWNISALLYGAVSFVLAFILIGIPMLIVLAVCYLVFTIMGTVAASRGEEYRYPLTIRFVK